MDNKKINLVPIVLEAAFVVLGVVLALAANEWRENVSHAAQAEKAMQTIHDEIQFNRAAVFGSLEYHFQLTDTLVTFMQAPSGQNDVSPFPDTRIFSKGFIAPASLLKTAWQTANSTGAVAYMKYEDVLDFSRIYEQQEDYEYQSQQGGQLVYNKLFNDGYAGMIKNYSNLTTIIFTFVYRECELVSAYDVMLSKMGPEDVSEENEMSAVCAQMARRR